MSDILERRGRRRTTMSDENRRGRGRPRKEEYRYDQPFRFNGTEEHAYMRKALEDELGMNGGEVMRMALETLYNLKIWGR